MKPIPNILRNLVRRRPMRLIEINGEPYLERYYMGTVLGRQLWLHRFVRDDSERHVHDHPWTALSLILTGGYTEQVATLVTMGRAPARTTLAMRQHDRRAPGINLIGAQRLHRITSVQPDTWTLMIVGPRHGKGWFFYSQSPDGVRARQPFSSTPDDWWRTAGTRAQVYWDRIRRNSGAAA